MNLSELTDAQLKTLRVKTINEIQKCNIIQGAKKVALNSAYGSCGNAWFRYYNVANASAITTAGQVSIKWIERKINEYLNQVLKTENKDFCVAIDTDSVVGETYVYKNGNKIKIADLYKNVCNEDNLIEKRDEYDFIHKIDYLDIKTKSYNGKLVDDKIIYIMKHKVKKKMYKIKINNNEVIVTEDHSIIVERRGKLLSVKPSDIIKSDVFIYLDESGGIVKEVF